MAPYAARSQRSGMLAMDRPSYSRSIVAQYQMLYMRSSVFPGSDDSGTIGGDATSRGGSHPPTSRGLNRFHGHKNGPAGDLPASQVCPQGLALVYREQ